MKRYTLVVTSFIVALSLSSCYLPISQQEFMNTSVAMTLTAQSWTLTPSNTPISTLTPTQTTTPTITLTPTPVPTSTPTMTPTQDPDRFYSSSSEYSFVPPKGWEAIKIESEDSNIKEPIFVGPNLGDYSLNIVFLRDQCPYGLFTYAASVQDDFFAGNGSVKQIQENYLVTDDGKDYFRWEFTISIDNIKYHQTFYFFGEDEEIMTAIYTRLDSNGSEMDTVVDKSMQSMIFHPLPDTVENGISG
ncbi:MAG: hypothetical protein ABFD58_00945 [Anaerolineaceae bacterium]